MCTTTVKQALSQISSSTVTSQSAFLRSIKEVNVKKDTDNE